jgi:hypothetical protein
MSNSNSLIPLTIAMGHWITQYRLVSAIVGGGAVVFVCGQSRPSKIGVIAIGFTKFSAGSLKIGSTRFGAQEGFPE